MKLWPWHRHRYKVIDVDHYDSVTGPRTICLGRCECGKHVDWTMKGHWELDQVTGVA
jgi:hypothetical protein